MARPEEVPQGWMHGRQFLIKEATEFMKARGFETGDRVKVVMVSRFGDCGLTKNLEATNGYLLRVAPNELVPVDGIPEDICPACHYELAEHDRGCLKPVSLGGDP